MHVVVLIERFEIDKEFVGTESKHTEPNEWESLPPTHFGSGTSGGGPLLSGGMR